MTEPERPQSVVVGIDGSQAALDATIWAVAEAVRLSVPLRLVHAAGSRRHHAESVLYRAEAAAHDTGRPVQIETVIARGRPDCVLVGESRTAALICVGSAGKGPGTPTPLGSTAAALTRHAHCPVALVRGPSQGGWVAAVQNDDPGNDEVVRRAMEEGRLRGAPVLLIDARLDSWVRRYPDVHVQTVAALRGTPPRRGESRGEAIQLAVVGGADADHVARLVWPDHHPLLGRAHRAVLIVRGCSPAPVTDPRADRHLLVQP